MKAILYKRVAESTDPFERAAKRWGVRKDGIRHDTRSSDRRQDLRPFDPPPTVEDLGEPTVEKLIHCRNREGYLKADLKKYSNVLKYNFGMLVFIGVSLGLSMSQQWDPLWPTLAILLVADFAVEGWAFTKYARTDQAISKNRAVMLGLELALYNRGIPFSPEDDTAF